MRHFLIWLFIFGLGFGSLEAQVISEAIDARQGPFGLIVVVAVLIVVLVCVGIIKRRGTLEQKEAQKRAEELKLWGNKQTLELKAANRDLTDAINQHAVSEKAARKSEAANLAILRALPDQIIRIDQSGQFLDFRVNMAYQSNLVLDDVGARCLDDMQSQSFVQQMKEHMALTLETGDMQGFEYETTLGDGTIFHEVRVVRESPNVVLAIVRGISSRKQMEKRIVQLERQQALGELSHGVSHNFNNILTGILGPAQLIQKKAKDDATVQASEMIIDSAKRAAELVQRLSRAVRTNENGKLYPVRVHDVVMDVIDRTEANLEDDVKISITSELETDLPIQGTWDGLIVILEHLLSNAIEALPEGGHIGVIARQVEKNVELIVKDDGIGLSEDIVRRVFEPFFTTKKEVGPGLGLTTVHGLVTSWKGEIAVESSVGKGSCFRIALPVYHVSELPEAEPQDLSDGQSLRLLIVDDEPIVRFTLSEYFEHYHSVDTAENGQEALAMFEKGAYDVALIDLSMPFMPGNEVGRKMREIDSNLSTALITGVPLTPDDPRMEGFDFYFTKPFTDLEKLRETLNQLWLDRKESTV